MYVVITYVAIVFCCICIFCMYALRKHLLQATYYCVSPYNTGVCTYYQTMSLVVGLVVTSSHSLACHGSKQTFCGWCIGLNGLPSLAKSIFLLYEYPMTDSVLSYHRYNISFITSVIAKDLSVRTQDHPIMGWNTHVQNSELLAIFFSYTPKFMHYSQKNLLKW